MKEIIFAGKGSIGLNCLEALQKIFHKIFIVNVSDDEIMSLKRKDDVVIENINDSNTHYVFLAGWFSLIKESELTKKKYINIHGSLLPKYRGIHSIFWAIMNFEEEIGYTIHEVNENIDDGNIIYQFRFKYKEQSIGEIQSLFYKDLYENLGHILDEYMDGKIDTIKQDKELATWVPRRNLEDCLIDFSWSNKMLNQYFLALSEPYPGPRILINHKHYEVINKKIVDREYFCDIGRVVNIDDEGVWIKTKEGFLVISLVKDTHSGELINPRNLIRNGYRF